jgi:hypothetical protein
MRTDTDTKVRVFPETLERLKEIATREEWSLAVVIKHCEASYRRTHRPYRVRKSQRKGGAGKEGEDGN